MHPHPTSTTSTNPAASVDLVKRAVKEDRPPDRGEEMKITDHAYRSAVAVALAAVFMLVWLALGVGILGPDGDRANLMYIGVLAVGIVGAAIARFEANGMARVLSAMALAQALVLVIALMAGVHRSGVSPVAEIAALNGFFIAMFLASAWLFAYAARERPLASWVPEE